MSNALQKLLQVIFLLPRPVFILVFILFGFSDLFASSFSLFPRKRHLRLLKRGLLTQQRKRRFSLAFLAPEALSCLFLPRQHLGPNGLVSDSTLFTI